MGFVQKKFQNVPFLKKKSTTDIFINCWTSVYIGLPEIIWLHRETSFTSETPRKLLRKWEYFYNSVKWNPKTTLDRVNDTIDNCEGYLTY